MRNIVIKAFKDSSNRQFALDDRSGLYVHGTTQKGLMDILGEDGYRIVAVTRKPTRTVHSGNNATFVVGERVNNGRTIAGFRIAQNKVKLLSGDNNDASVMDIEEATHYVAPIVNTTRTRVTATSRPESVTMDFSAIKSAIEISHPRQIRLERTLKA